MAGPETLAFGHAAAHKIDNSRDVLRLMAVGVTRPWGLPSDDLVPWCRLRRTQLPR